MIVHYLYFQISDNTDISVNLHYIHVCLLIDIISLNFTVQNSYFCCLLININSLFAFILFSLWTTPNKK